MLLSMCIVQLLVISCRSFLLRLMGMRRIAWRHFAKMFLGNMVLPLFPNIQHPHKPWFTKGFTSLGPVRGCLWLGDGIKRIDSGTQSLEVARPNLLLCVAALCSSNSTMSFVCSQCQTQGEVPKFSKSWQISWRNSAARALLDMLLTP